MGTSGSTVMVDVSQLTAVSVYSQELFDDFNSSVALLCYIDTNCVKSKCRYTFVFQYGRTLLVF